jgi:lipoprotein-releasing system ATP-binding protein
MSETILKAEGLGKCYPTPKGLLRVFEGLDFELEKGDIAAVMGVSGVGKTTLLNLLGGLDRPTEGRVLLQGRDIFDGDETRMAAVRNSKIGFVFQFFHLLPEFTALENICMPLLIQGLPRKKAYERAALLLEEVGMADRGDFRPGQLSGGEQQRVAVARALVNDPLLLLADEPTGNLDWRTGETIFRLILELHERKGLSSVIVTHNERVARYCRKAFLMEAGSLKRIEPPER